MVEKTEASFRRMLKDMTDSQIRQYYKDLEWTAFPVLIIKEYQKRFSAQNSKKMVDRLKMQTEIAMQQSDVLKKAATERGAKVIRQASETVSQAATSAKKMAYSPEKSLELLEKLASLRKKGVITDREFEDKKREILRKI